MTAATMLPPSTRNGRKQQLPDTLLSSQQGSSLLDDMRAQLKLVQTGISCGFYLMTPEFAGRILESMNHPHNRRKKSFKIAMMKDDMQSGLWRISHQGIAFNVDGWLVDGQNRLQAVVDSGVSITMLVFFDVPNDSMRVFDTGTTRLVQDAARISGDLETSNLHVAICKRMMAGIRQNTPLSNQHNLELIEKHKEAISFAIAAFGGKEKKITTAPIYGMVARAWYTQNRDRLTAFCQQLRTGMPDTPAEDQAAVVLRNWLIGTNSTGRYGAYATILVYKKAERALVAFLAKQKIQKLYEVQTEQFPLPGEQPANLLPEVAAE